MERVRDELMAEAVKGSRGEDGGGLRDEALPRHLFLSPLPARQFARLSDSVRLAQAFILTHLF